MVSRYMAKENSGFSLPRARRPESGIFLSIVIPAYNEATRIHKVLIPTIAYLNVQSYKSEIIVVSDGSCDNTIEEVNSFRSQYQALRTIEYFPNQGKGKAVRTGMLAAEGRYTLFMDADYSVPIETIEDALRAMQGGYDVVIGSRAVENADIQKRQSLLRELSGKVYGRAQNTWLGLDFSDTQCGFKLFESEKAFPLFSQQRLSSVIFDGEILFLASRRGYRIKELPVKWTHDPDSRIRYRNPLKLLTILWELLKVRMLHIRDWNQPQVFGWESRGLAKPKGEIGCENR